MIRDPAAMALARQLLELRPSGIIPLTDEYYIVVARMIQTYVMLDEQRQRTEAGSAPKPMEPR